MQNIKGRKILHMEWKELFRQKWERKETLMATYDSPHHQSSESQKIFNHVTGMINKDLRKYEEQ